jgi:dihydrofolate reductase
MLVMMGERRDNEQCNQIWEGGVVFFLSCIYLLDKMYITHTPSVKDGGGAFFFKRDGLLRIDMSQ